MGRTLAKLQAHIKNPRQNPHVFTAGRTVNYQVPDCVSDGFVMLTQSADLGRVDDIDNETIPVVTGEDIGVS